MEQTKEKGQESPGKLGKEQGCGNNNEPRGNFEPLLAGDIWGENVAKARKMRRMGSVKGRKGWIKHISRMESQMERARGGE